MSKNIIVGNGFSAFICKIFFKKNIEVLGVKNSNFFEKKTFFQRKNLNANKFFSHKSQSFGNLVYSLKNTRLHDRLSFGGNSNVWGGKINIKKLPKIFFKTIKSNKILLKKLSFKNTGTISNDSSIMQLQNQKNKILDIKNTKINIKNGYLLNFTSKKNYLILNYLSNKDSQIRKLKVRNLYLCIGTVQLIDLLYRSRYLKSGDIIKLSEFDHKFKLKFFFSKFDPNAITVVRYSFSRAIGHLLGIQYYSLFLKLLDFIPLVIDQNFYKKKNTCLLRINKNVLTDLNDVKFGNSIHYCNMIINGQNINKFLNKINKNIKGFGMPFVNQKKPGPISNEIIEDVIQKLR